MGNNFLRLLFINPLCLRKMSISWLNERMFPYVIYVLSFTQVHLIDFGIHNTEYQEEIAVRYWFWQHGVYF